VALLDQGQPIRQSQVLDLDFSNNHLAGQAQPIQRQLRSIAESQGLTALAYLVLARDDDVGGEER
jgi:hypothetical protein